MRKIWLCAGILTLSVFALLTPNLTHAVSQPDIPTAPTLDKPVVDQTGTLTQQQIDAISARITETRGQKSYQIGVLMIKSLNGYPIEEYTIKVAREWGIGQKEKNNGILLFVAKDDRRMRIEVGSGLEGDLTDLQTSRILDNTIAPEFKKGEYYLGIYKGVDSIAALVQGQPDPNEQPSGGGSIIDVILSFGWIAFFALMWLGSVLARSKSWWAGGVVGGVVGVIIAIIFGLILWTIITFVALIIIGLVLDLLVSRNYKEHRSLGDLPAWWAGGGWGGGLGGGGGGFGGGGFSGGGSSGSW